MQNKKFLFSIIIPIYNVENYLEETILSVINQTLNFKKNCQLVLINDGSPDNSEKICLKYKKIYPDNIIYYKQENSGVSEARNKGIELATGEFVNFLDSDDKWSKNSFKIVYNMIKKHKDISLFSCRMNFFDAKKGSHNLNYKYEKNRIINVLEDYEFPQLSSSSLFIKKDAIGNHRYDKKIKYAEDNKFINEIIFEQKKIMMLKKPIYYYRKRANGGSAIDAQAVDLDWYLVTTEKVFKYLFDLSEKKFGKVIDYIQYLTIYDISWRISLSDTFSISEKDRKKYETILKGLIKRVDKKIIINHPHLNLEQKLFLLEINGEKNIKKMLRYDDNNVCLNEYTTSKIKLKHLIIDQIYIKDGKFEIFGKLDRKFVSEKEFKVKKNDKNIKVKYYDLTVDCNINTFSKTKLHDYIGINIVLNKDEDWTLGFYLNDIKLVPRFNHSGIFSEYLPKSYHHVKNRTYMFDGYRIFSFKRNLLKSFIYEIKNEFFLLKKKKIKILTARVFTKIYRLFKKKEIWLISDRVNKADDNGEHLFEYIIKNHPEKKCYYVLSKKSNDYERIKKIGQVIDPNSLKYKMIFNCSDYVISSHAENYIFNPLGNSDKYIKDQYQFKYIFLQHGITKDDLSSWINVNTKKMDMFVSATTDEYKSLLNKKYSFGPKIVKLTGFTRYDSLLKKKSQYKVKNKIMLSLTWRNSLTSRINKKTGERLYSKDFKKSDYFKFLSNLMTDKKLQKVLKEYDYKIRFIPHPNVLCQLKDFPVNEFVEIEEKSVNYQKEFCENKMLITDYSSVFFDFGYLNKPIIYYQADKVEFYKGQVYNKGYFDYNTMGFGPVFEDYDKFINYLIKMVKNDCKIDKKYEKIIDNTFKYRDNKNCERVYNEIINLDK